MAETPKPEFAKLEPPSELNTGEFQVPNKRWFPSTIQIVMMSSFASGLVAVCDVLEHDAHTVKHALAIFVKTSATWFISYFGMRSAGPK